MGVRTPWLLALALAACGPASSDPPPMSEPEAEPVPTTEAPVVTVVAPAPPPTLVGASPDVVIALSPGDTHRTLALDVDHACPFARAELVVEIESMPDGHVTLVSPSGASSQRPLHVLTTSHFFHTFDWADLDALHAARGTPLAGRWTLTLALRGADYCGGSCEGGASPMPEPRLVSGELRLWCERPVHASTEPTLVALAHPSEPHLAAGAALRALFSVEADCEVVAMRAEIRGRAPPFGASFVLVAPDGRSQPVAHWSRAGGGGDPKLVADLAIDSGTHAAGLWELRAEHAGRDAAIEGGSLAFDCAR